MTANANDHAIVFGASGIIGWALVDQLLQSYPQKGSFKKVTAITSRPLKTAETFWPEPNSQRPRLELVSGIDLRSGDGVMLAKSLRQAVGEVDTVTHIFYLVFNAMDDAIQEVATNLRMLQNVIDAHTLTSPNLKFVAFPGGTRGYGIYAAGGTFSPPLTEDMVDNLPPDYANTVVYPAYRKLLTKASEGKAWDWCEVCPDVIVGFTPNGSQFSLALHWAQYLSLYAYNHGIGPASENDREGTVVEIPFPGSQAGSQSLFSPASSRTIARFMIYASLHPDTCGDGRLFNVADDEIPSKNGEIWPKLATWFGLKGTGPIEHAGNTQSQALGVKEFPGTAPLSLTPGDYIAKHKDVFARHGLDNALTGGVGAGSKQLDSVGYWLTFDRQLSLERLRSTGFEGSRDPVQGWLESFEMFRKAGLIF